MNDLPRLALLPILVLATATGYAQGDEGFSGRVALGYLATSGNAENKTLSTRFDLDWTYAPWHHALTGAAVRASTNAVTTAEAYSLDWQSDYDLSERSYVFGVVAWDDDTEVEPRLCGLEPRAAGGTRAPGRARAQTHPQCAHAAHEGARLRRRLSLRPRRRRPCRGPGVSARRLTRGQVVRAHGPGLREDGGGTPEVVGGAERVLTTLLEFLVDRPR